MFYDLLSVREIMAPKCNQYKLYAFLSFWSFYLMNVSQISKHAVNKKLLKAVKVIDKTETENWFERVNAFCDKVK